MKRSTAGDSKSATGFVTRVPTLGKDLVNRPLWTVLIPARNCGSYLQETVQSVLQQDRGVEQMEIIILDDCSDDPSEAQSWTAQTQGRVRVLRHETNVGKSANYQSGLEASRGHLIHVLHGDDFVGPGFYQTMEACFEQYPEAGAFFSESEYIDEQGEVIGRTGQLQPTSGILESFAERQYVNQQVQTPSIVMRRTVYESVGGFDHRLTAFEDWEMWFRASLSFPVGFNANALAAYRVSSGNTSTASVLEGRRPRLFRLVLDIMDRYCPDEIKSRKKDQRAEAIAECLLQFSLVAARHRAWIPWIRIFCQSISHVRSWRQLRRVIGATLRGFMG